MQHSPAHLAECLSYDPLSGVIRWRRRPREHFASERAHAIHLATKAGAVAGCLDKSTGYLVIGLGNKLYYAHRIAWALQHGEWPPEQIDHIDGDKLNNSARNLRAVSHAENNRNSPMKSTNRSGVTGVSFAKREGKWRARVTYEGRDLHLGYFSTKQEAVDARLTALDKLGFHENHGRAA